MPIEISSINTLRALPIPGSGVNSTVFSTEGYYQAGDGGDNTFLWDAASTDNDNGGTVIACTANGAATGRFVALNYGTGRNNVRQFGAHPLHASATQNRLAFQAANDNLLPFGYPATASGRLARQGVIYVPPGSYVLDGSFLPYNGVHVYGDGWAQHGHPARAVHVHRRVLSSVVREF